MLTLEDVSAKESLSEVVLRLMSMSGSKEAFVIIVMALVLLLAFTSPSSFLV